MRRPTTIRTLELDRLRLGMGVHMRIVCALSFDRADRARRKLLDGLSTGAECGEWRLGERVEEVVLAEDRDGLLFRGGLGFLEPAEERTSLRCSPSVGYA